MIKLLTVNLLSGLALVMELTTINKMLSFCVLATALIVNVKKLKSKRKK